MESALDKKSPLAATYDTGWVRKVQLAQMESGSENELFVAEEYEDCHEGRPPKLSARLSKQQRRVPIVLLTLPVVDSKEKWNKNRNFARKKRPKEMDGLRRTRICSKKKTLEKLNIRSELLGESQRALREVVRGCWQSL